MSVEFRNVPGRPEPEGYTHLSIASGERIVHIAGQTGTDAAGDVVPGGLGSQAEQALRNLFGAVEHAGATRADIAKLTIYVVEWSPARFEELVGGLVAAEGDVPSPSVPATLIGVSALFEPELLIEIEGVAVF